MKIWPADRSSDLINIGFILAYLAEATILLAALRGLFRRAAEGKPAQIDGG